MRTRTAAVLLWGAVAYWAWQAAREADPSRRIWWLAAAVIVGLTAWGVWRGLPPLLAATRRSTFTIALLFGVLMVMPLSGAPNEATLIAVRLRLFAPMILWAAVVTALLWNSIPAPPRPAPPPSEAPPPTGRKRKRRRRKGR